MVDFYWAYAKIQFRRGGKARVVLAEMHKQEEDLESHSQLPYYEDFQGYEVGTDGF